MRRPALPTAIGPMMLAVQYKLGLDESEATILFSTVLSMLTIRTAYSFKIPEYSL